MIKTLVHSNYIKNNWPKPGFKKIKKTFPKPACYYILFLGQLRPLAYKSVFYF